MRRVLVVDDDREVGSAVREVLAPDGFTVDAPDTPQEALVELLRARPDLVILDINMPGMSGWEFCSILRRQTMTRTLPVLFLTGRGEIRDRITAMQFGGSAYLGKPFAAGELREKVRTLLEPPAQGGES